MCERKKSGRGMDADRLRRILGIVAILTLIGTVIGTVLVLVNKKGYRIVTCTSYLGSNQVEWRVGNSTGIGKMHTSERFDLPSTCWLWVGGSLHSSDTVIFYSPTQLAQHFGIGIGSGWAVLALVWFIAEAWCIDPEMVLGSYFTPPLHKVVVRVVIHETTNFENYCLILLPTIGTLLSLVFTYCS